MSFERCGVRKCQVRDRTAALRENEYNALLDQQVCGSEVLICRSGGVLEIGHKSIQSHIRLFCGLRALLGTSLERSFRAKVLTYER